MTEPFPIERITRLDLQPTEVLAFTPGIDLKPWQCQELGESLSEWLAQHGVHVAGVLVAPKGTQLTAIPAQAPTTDDTPSGEASVNDLRRQHGIPERQPCAYCQWLAQQKPGTVSTWRTHDPDCPHHVPLDPYGRQTQP